MSFRMCCLSSSDGCGHMFTVVEEDAVPQVCPCCYKPTLYELRGYPLSPDIYSWRSEFVFKPLSVWSV